MWVKICGTTTLADARLAAESGADAVGFIFAPSRRRVTSSEVAAITPLLPPSIERVGVFTEGSPEEIAAAARHAGLTTVQLHGDFPETFFDRFAGSSEGRFAVIRTLHWTVPARQSSDQPSDTSEPAADPALQAKVLSSHLLRIERTAPADRVLLDSRVGEETGGTGVNFPWRHMAAALIGLPAPSATDNARPRLIVAGGLTCENVAEAIESLRPYGVDVASGVEASPGKKDPGAVRRFVEQARSAAGN